MLPAAALAEVRAGKGVPVAEVETSALVFEAGTVVTAIMVERFDDGEKVALAYVEVEVLVYAVLVTMVEVLLATQLVEVVYAVPGVNRTVVVTGGPVRAEVVVADAPRPVMWNG
jgi:hypothetical protein